VLPVLSLVKESHLINFLTNNSEIMPVDLGEPIPAWSDGKAGQDFGDWFLHYQIGFGYFN
jgi:hypothetical protein